MNDESLSALLDGECSPSELDDVLAALDRDPALRDRFSRYALGRETRRGVRVRGDRVDLAGRVRSALAAEPEIRAKTTSRLNRWLPLAAAAAVGAMAVMVLRPESEVAPALVTAGAAGDAPAGHGRAAGDSQLRNYLMTYSQSRAQHGVGGSLGYARYAAYSAEPVRKGER